MRACHAKKLDAGHAFWRDKDHRNSPIGAHATSHVKKVIGVCTEGATVTGPLRAVVLTSLPAGARAAQLCLRWLGQVR